MFADAVARITESIFPIFFLQELADDCVMGVCGTGFFVDSQGLFVTADHFMTPTPPGCAQYYYGKVPDQVCEPALEIERVANDPERDIFVGRVKQHYLPPVDFCPMPLRPGEAVCMSGYPMATVMANESGGCTGNVRRYWQPTYVIDATQVGIGNRMYEGYIVQHACLSGMSGGPVFDTEGKVRGVGLANLTRRIPEPDDNVTVVSNGIVIGLEHVLRLLESL